MTLEEFLDRIDEIMCGTSNTERAYLEELYDEITKPHWISVNDELPPIVKQSTIGWPRSEEIFIYCKEDDIVTIGFYIENTGWKCITEEYIGPVTHWMPLPSVEHLKDK